MDLIPTFRRGQRVTIHLRPIEQWCPVCDKVVGQKYAGSPASVRGICLGPTRYLLERCECGAIYPISPGNYDVSIVAESGEHMILTVPYSLLLPLVRAKKLRTLREQAVRGRAARVEKLRTLREQI